MRPTVSEQLDGVCRILETVIAPEIHTEHTRETLRSLISNLRMLNRAWDSLLPFLRWDNAETIALLLAARNDVDEARCARIDATLAAAPSDLSESALNAFNALLRERLSECLDIAQLEQRILAHLAERAARYPLRLTGAVPKHSS
jgi:hypothetical protein